MVVYSLLLLLFSIFVKFFLYISVMYIQLCHFNDLLFMFSSCVVSCDAPFLPKLYGTCIHKYFIDRLRNQSYYTDKLYEHPST